MKFDEKKRHFADRGYEEQHHLGELGFFDSVKFSCTQKYDVEKQFNFLCRFSKAVEQQDQDLKQQLTDSYT